MRWLLIFALLIGATSCGNDGPTSPGEPPALRGVTLSPDSVLVDTVLVTVAADRADSVSLWIDNARYAVDTAPPYLFRWNSRSVADGRHAFALRVKNSGGYVDSVFSRRVSNYGELRLALSSVPDKVRLGRAYQLGVELLSGPPDTPVTWSLAQGPSHGTIDDTGLYRAPEFMPNPPLVTFRATAAGDPPVVVEATAGMGWPIEVSVYGYPLAIYRYQSYQLSVRVDHTADRRVRWSIDEGPDHGIIDQNGLYTAPPVTPPSSAVTFRATSLEDTTVSGTATGYIVGDVSLDIRPDSAWAHPGGKIGFDVAIEGAPPQSVQWWVVGGSRSGWIDASGTYTAPPEIDGFQEARVVASSYIAPDVRDTAVVELRPWPADPERMLAMFETLSAAASISEQATGMAATALASVRFLSGDAERRWGELSQTSTSWKYTAFNTADLLIFPWPGPARRLDFDLVTGGPSGVYDELHYDYGFTYLGDLNFRLEGYPEGPSLQVASTSRSLSAASKPGSWAAGSEFERTMQGTILAAEGGNLQVDATVAGLMWAGYDAVYVYRNFDLAVSGAVTRPNGMKAVGSIDFADHRVLQFITVDALTQSYDGTFTVWLDGDEYRWRDISFFRSWSGGRALDPEQWHASGTILKNGAFFGEVRFNGPVTADMTVFPEPVADFGQGVEVPLSAMPVTIREATGPADNPFDDLP